MGVSTLVPQVVRSEPQFRLLFGAQSLSVLGDRIATVAFPFAVLAAGGNLREVALVSAAQFIPFVVLALPAGVLADRSDRIRILLASDAIRLACQAVAGTLLLAGFMTPAHLMVAAAVYGTADAFFGPAFAGLLPSTVAKENVQAANAVRALSYSVGNILGPAAAGVLIALSGPGAAFCFDALTFAISIVGLIALQRSMSKDPSSANATRLNSRRRFGLMEKGFGHNLREGWHAVQSRPWVLAFLAAMGTYHLIVLPSVFVLGPVIMDRHYDGAQSWALITVGFGVGSLLGDLLLVRWRPRRAMAVAALSLAIASCQAALIGSGLPAWLIGALVGCCGVGVSAAFTLWMTSIGEHVPSTSRSRVSSYDFLVTSGSIPLGNLLAGLAAAHLGLRPTLFLMSLLGGSVCLLVASLRSVRALPREQATA